MGFSTVINLQMKLVELMVGWRANVVFVRPQKSSLHQNQSCVFETSVPMAILYTVTSHSTAVSREWHRQFPNIFSPEHFLTVRTQCAGKGVLLAGDVSVSNCLWHFVHP
jgi:hypothetical protein